MNNVFVKLYSYFPAATNAEQNIINEIINNSQDLLNLKSGIEKYKKIHRKS